MRAPITDESLQIIRVTKYSVTFINIEVHLANLAFLYVVFIPFKIGDNLKSQIFEWYESWAGNFSCFLVIFNLRVIHVLDDEEPVFDGEVPFDKGVGFLKGVGIKLLAIFHEFISMVTIGSERG